MNITKENSSELTALLKIEIAPEDYQPLVDKTLKEQQKKAAMPGFRPGKVPVGVIKKMYGKAILAEELNKLVSESMAEYFKANNLNVLGSPLTNEEKQQPIDFDNPGHYEFYFDLGFTPNVTVELNEKIKVPYYNILADDASIEDILKDIRRRYGNVSTAETAEEKDMVYGNFVELDENGQVKEGGITYKTWVSAEFVKDADVKKKLIGIKKDEVLTVVPFKLTENERGAAGLIGQKGDNVAQVHNTFTFTIDSITRIAPADMNEELFKKVYPNDAIVDEKEFIDRIKQEMSGSYQAQAERQFMSDMVDVLIKETNISLPEEFLKRWLLEQKDITPDQLAAEFDKYKDALKWQIIENEILKQSGIVVSEEEVKDHFKNYMRAQFAAYAGDNAEEMEAHLEGYAKRAMENKETVKNAYDLLYDERIKAYAKSKITLDEKEIAFNDFTKLLSGKA